ncbi:MAG: hypothetical protein AB7O62_11105 [Pirellulales bacterium]
MARILKVIAWLAAGGLLVLVAIGLWAYRASQKEPEFYRQAIAADPEGQDEASDDMLRQVTALASRAQRAGEWEAIFTAEQINGWLAVDLVKNHSRSLPRGVSDPRVAITPDQVSWACRWDNGSISTVISIETEIYIAEANVLAVRLKSAQAGQLPVPLEHVLDDASQVTSKMDVVVRWTRLEGDPVALVTIPPPEGEGDTLVWIEDLDVREGEIYLSGQTLPRGETPATQMRAELQTAEEPETSGKKL